MKKQSTLLLVLLLCSICAFGQWNIAAYRNGLVYWAKNADTLITASNGNIVNISYDGGINWTTFQTGVFGDCWTQDIHFPTASVGYISGGSAFGLYKQFIIKTTDGGNTWDSLAADVFNGYGVNSLWFVNADTGFISAGISKLWKTTDGGNSFTYVSLSPSTYINDIYFLNEQIGFLATSQMIASNNYAYSLLRTNDGGTSWAAVYTDTMIAVTGLNHRSINEVKFVDGSNGFAVGGNGLFLKTTDGGLHWTKNFIHPHSNLTTVDFVNLSTGYINNAGSIFKTVDGGNSWQIQSINPIALISKIDMVNDTLGYAFNESAVYKTYNSGGAITSINKITLNNLFTIFPNPASKKINLNYPNDIIIHSLYISDALGKTIRAYSKDETILDINGLASGLYFLDIRTVAGNVSKQFLIQQ